MVIWKTVLGISAEKNDPLHKTKKIEPPSGQKVGFKIRLFDLYFYFWSDYSKRVILKLYGG